MTIVYHPEMIQGDDDWLAARRGRLCASEMKLIITPATLKPAANDKQRAHFYELLAQRITDYTEPSYVSDDMLRGREDEVLARYTYSEKYEPVTEVGFVTNDRWGFTIGYSPDGLVGERGLFEAKSRRQRFQIETILSNAMPDDFTIQTQTGLLVTERDWLDFSSFSGGLPMVTIRIFPVPEIQDAIIAAAAKFEFELEKAQTAYNLALASDRRLIPTERRIVQEMYT